MRLSKRGWVAAKAVIWIAALLPAAWLGWDATRGELGANPIEALQDRTGWWGLVLLTVTLAITPVRRLTGWHSIVRVRRLVGLFAFFYICLHLTNYVVLDQWFDFSMILEDITERPFITVGFAAWLILLALAITSTRGWIRRLGRNWQRLHRLVYVAAGLGTLHFFWKVKADTREPLVFVAIVVVLLLLRLPVLVPALRRVRRPIRRGRPSTTPS
jgi:sulfoxide reductase heme-binding subunit YedZ